jgi:hypothetical protein
MLRGCGMRGEGMWRIWGRGRACVESVVLYFGINLCSTGSLRLLENEWSRC